jgi:hypothetical protein
MAAEVVPRELTYYRCGKCDAVFPTYAGTVAMAWKRRAGDKSTHAVLLSGSRLGRVFLFRDDAGSEIELGRGDLVLLAFRNDRVVVVENLTSGAYWILRTSGMRGCIVPVLLGTLFALVCVGGQSVWCSRSGPRSFLSPCPARSLGWCVAPHGSRLMRGADRAYNEGRGNGGLPSHSVGRTAPEADGS